MNLSSVYRIVTVDLRIAIWWNKEWFISHYDDNEEQFKLKL